MAKIANEKAGIIKPGIPVVIGEAKPETKLVFEKAAKKNDAEIHFAQRRKIPTKVKSDLKGTYQQKNIKTVLTAIDVLNENGYRIPATVVKKGIAHTIANTGLQGRWQTLYKVPHMIADIGHNVDGIKEVLKNLKTLKYNRLFMVLGFAGDKEIEKILELLPKEAFYIFTQAKNQRAFPSTKLAELATKIGLSCYRTHTVHTALSISTRAWQPGDLIFVGGSAYVVAEAIPNG